MRNNSLGYFIDSIAPMNSKESAWVWPMCGELSIGMVAGPGRRAKQAKARPSTFHCPSILVDIPGNQAKLRGNPHHETKTTDKNHEKNIRNSRWRGDVGSGV